MTLSSSAYAETSKPYSRLLYNADAEMALLGTILVHMDYANAIRDLALQRDPDIQ